MEGSLDLELVSVLELVYSNGAAEVRMWGASHPDLFLTPIDVAAIRICAKEPVATPSDLRVRTAQLIESRGYPRHSRPTSMTESRGVRLRFLDVAVRSLALVMDGHLIPTIVSGDDRAFFDFWVALDQRKQEISLVGANDVSRRISTPPETFDQAAILINFVGEWRYVRSLAAHAWA